VSARQKLIQVTGEMNRTTVLAQRGQIGGNLPVQQAQFLQFAAVEAGKAATCALFEKLFEPRPVGLALI
jgi:hypothetical protein